jgi:hypothetical protein
LEITSASVADGLPGGASVILNNNTPGTAILVFFSSAELPAGSQTIINLQANVPNTMSETGDRRQLLDLHSVTISDGNDNEFPVIVDDALHIGAYFGDVSGNARINASDAARVARLAALLDTGFEAFPLIAPQVLSDISGNGRVNAADASLLARFAALLPVPEIPPIPAGAAAADGRLDPTLTVGGFFDSDRRLEDGIPEDEMKANVDAQVVSISAEHDRAGGVPAGSVTLKNQLGNSGVRTNEETSMVTLEEAIDEFFSGDGRWW